MTRWTVLTVAILLTVPLGAPAATAGAAGGGMVEATAAAPWSGTVERPPIVILDDTMFTPANGVVAGTGTASDPFVISGWEIDGSRWAPSTGVLGSSPFPPGIFIQGTSAHVVIQGNVIVDNPRSQVQVVDAEHVTIQGNVLERTADAPRRAPFDDGVTLEGVRDVTVTGNTITLDGEPQGANGVIAVREAPWRPPLQNVVVEGNAITWRGTTSNSVHGVYTAGGEGVTVEGNALVNDGSAGRWEAVQAERTQGLRVAGHDLGSPGSAATSVGFLLGETTNAEVVDNNVTGFTTALRGVDLAGSHLENNTLEAGTWGLRLDRGDDLVLRGNALSGNTFGLSIRGTHAGDYRHDVDASNTVDGVPVRYLVGVQDTVVTAEGAGYVGLVDAVNVTVTAAASASPGNGEGVLVVEGERVTVDAGDRSESARAVDVRWSQDVRVTNLTGHDAVLEGGLGLRLDNSSLTDGSQGVRVAGAGHVRVENATLLRNDVGVNVTGSSTVDLFALEVKGNEVGVRYEDSTGTLNASSIAFNHLAGASSVASAGEVSFLDATGSWWGASDGPGGEGPGSGDAVTTGGEGSAHLVYDPWLTSEPAVAGR